MFFRDSGNQSLYFIYFLTRREIGVKLGRRLRIFLIDVHKYRKSFFPQCRNNELKKNKKTRIALFGKFYFAHFAFPLCNYLNLKSWKIHQVIQSLWTPPTFINFFYPFRKLQNLMNNLIPCYRRTAAVLSARLLAALAAVPGEVEAGVVVSESLKVPRIPRIHLISHLVPAGYRRPPP